MSEYKSLGQITAHLPLSRHNMEELAARQLSILPSGGVKFARTSNREQKDAARQHVLDLFHPNQWPGRLHMLTMPGVQWRFERLLLGTREAGWMRRSTPNRTYFTGIENDRAIYFAAVTQMPGLHTPNTALRRLKPMSFAELGVKTRYASFFFANVDDLAIQPWKPWGAAWLDFTGQLTIRRMKLIKHLYQHLVSDVLIVTAMNGRWERNTSNAITKAGGYSEWLHKNLPGEVLHYVEYIDTTAMAQFAVRKIRWQSPLV